MRSSSLIPSEPVHRSQQGVERLTNYTVRKLTIYPGIADDYAAFRELELGSFYLDSFVLQHCPLDPRDLFAIRTSMDVGPETYVRLDIALREIHNSFVNTILC